MFVSDEAPMRFNACIGRDVCFGIRSAEFPFLFTVAARGEEALLGMGAGCFSMGRDNIRRFLSGPKARTCEDLPIRKGHAVFTRFGRADGSVCDNTRRLLSGSSAQSAAFRCLETADGSFHPARKGSREPFAGSGVRDAGDCRSKAAACRFGRTDGSACLFAMMHGGFHPARVSKQGLFAVLSRQAEVFSRFGRSLTQRLCPIRGRSPGQP